MSGSPRKPNGLTRRSFLASVAAGSVVLLAQPVAALAATAKRAATKRATPAPSAPASEFDKQRAGTLATLKVIRARVLPPGGDLGVVFQPLRPRRGAK